MNITYYVVKNNSTLYGVELLSENEFNSKLNLNNLTVVKKGDYDECLKFYTSFNTFNPYENDNWYTKTIKNLPINLLPNPIKFGKLTVDELTAENCFDYYNVLINAKNKFENN